MMRIQILQIAPTKDANLKALEAEFEKRLQPFFKLETLTLQASKKDEREAVQEEERLRFLGKWDQGAHVLALDERGSQITSEGFAELLRQQRDFGTGNLQILIGGSHGLHPELLQKAHAQLSFSKMTFTHEMIRVFLKEQLYRAATLLVCKRYHK